MAGLIAASDAKIRRVGETGYRDVGNTILLDFTLESETKTRKSMQNSSYGAALETVVFPQPSKLKIGIDDVAGAVGKHNLALALLGNLEDFTTSESAIAAEDVVVAHDLWVPLAQKPVKAGSVSIATHSEGTDYLIDYQLGMIKALSSGSITDASTVTINYTQAANAGYTITPNQHPSIKVELQANCINLATNKHFHLHIFRVPFAAASVLALMSEDFMTIESEAEMEIPEGQIAPYTMTFYD